MYYMVVIIHPRLII